MRLPARALALTLLLLPAAAQAMDQASSPAKFPIPWGNSAGSAYVRSIPTPSQIGIQNCAASLTDGFPPLTFIPASAGGCPPFGQDFNGVLKQLSQWSRWTQAGGPVYFDSAFSTAIGGYPKGAILQSAVTPGTMWLCTADSNNTDPDNGGANWVQAPGQVPIGTPMQALTSTVPSGYVSANGLTIGNASSNATNRASADTQFLFAFVWVNCPNATCPIFTSAGSASTRGATAAADFAANKALAVNNMNGSALMGADSQSGTSTNFLLNVPVTSGGRTVPGSVLGENLHTLVPGEIPTIHSSSDTPPLVSAHANALLQGTGSGVTFIDSVLAGTINSTSTNTGGGSHNTVARSVVAYWNLKL